MRVTRRDLLAAAGLATTIGSVSVSAAEPSAILLVDPTLPPAARRAAEGHGATSRVIVEPDLVRQWRDGLEKKITGAGGAFALVRWDKALLLCGLARECGLRTRQQRLGRAVILVSIGREDRI